MIARIEKPHEIFSPFSALSSCLLNRRRTVRFPTEIQARVTLLEEPVVTLAARIRNMSEGGLQVLIDRSSRLGSSLRLEVDDVSMYGQIRYCSPWRGAFIIGVCVDLILIGENELTCSVPDLLEYWATANTDLPAEDLPAKTSA